MFVPLALLAQRESILYTPEDLILALDKWVLPRYPDCTTPNPAMTKLECMGVLNSFHQAGKFHLSLKPVEVERAVNAFMEDRLWVNSDTLDAIPLLPSQRPEGWMAKPTIYRVLTRAFPQVISEFVSVTWGLVVACATYTWWSFKAPRDVSVPKSPNERKMTAPLSLVKKDS